MKAELEKRADRAAQDIMNLLAQALIECGVWSIPLTFKMSKSRVAALILTRFQQPEIGAGEDEMERARR